MQAPTAKHLARELHDSEDRKTQGCPREGIGRTVEAVRLYDDRRGSVTEIAGQVLSEYGL